MFSIELIAGAYRMSAQLIHRMIDDLTPIEFTHQPCPGANSAVWIIGHLAETLQRTAVRLHATEQARLPVELAARFATTKLSASDQSDLGDPQVVVMWFDRLVDVVLAALPGTTPDSLKGPSPMPGPFAKTFGEALLFGALHIAMHSGQLSTIRRSLGKPPLV